MDVPTRPNGFLDLSRLGPTLEDAATLWIGDFVEVYENGQPLPRPTVVAARVSLPSDKSFASYEQAVASFAAPALPTDTDLYWQDGLLDVRFEFPIQSDQSRFAIQPGLTRLGLRVNVVLRLLAPGSQERVFDVHGETGIVRARPALVPGGVALHEGRVLPHPRRHRPPAVPAVPGDPVPPAAAPGGGGHGVHGGALDHAHRLGVRHGAERPVVPAPHRDADCRLDRLHGAREHHRRPPRTALDRDVRLRPGARVRLLVRAARVAAVRRQPSRHVAPGLQRRRRARASCWCCS